MQVSGVGYNSRGDVICNGCQVDGNSHPSLSKVIEVGCICNNAEICSDGLHGQPTEGALLACALKVRTEWANSNQTSVEISVGAHSYQTSVEISVGNGCVLTRF